MTEQLLLLAKPRRQWELTFSDTNVAQLAEQAVAAFRNAYGREISVDTDAPSPIRANTDADKLTQLLFILLDNARKYSQEPIGVTVGTERGNPYIRVTDRGIGIPKEELSRVFDRFYRVDKARSRDQEQEGGAGLGLSLAREIAEAIGSRIVLDSVEGLGTSATILLPAEAPPNLERSQ